MSTHRFFNLIIVIALVAVLALTVQTAFSRNGSYRESSEQAAYEYHMHERYGETVPEELLVRVAAIKAAHEYRMHEWYGESVPEELLVHVAALKAARENRLREGP